MAGCFECFGRRPRAPPPPPPPRPANPPAPPAKHPGGAAAYDSDPLRDPHLSSLTDPDPRPASRDLQRADSKKQRRDLKRNPSHAVTQTDAETNGAVDSGVAGATAEAQDNNGLSRGQNFAKVEKWLRDAARHSPIVIVPGVIANIEDPKPGAAIAPGAYDPPTEHDRLPPMMPVAQSQLALQS